MARVLSRRWLPPGAIHHGTLRVVGLDADVLVRRDRYGIVHVEAGTDRDAWFACGFCQGQDRSLQLGARAVDAGPFGRGVTAGGTVGRRRPSLPAALVRDDDRADAAAPHWYLVHVRTPTTHMAGAQPVGAAALIAGHDERDLWAPPSGTSSSLRVLSRGGGWEHLRVAYPGGQSDEPDSRHYDDLLPFWDTGGGVPIAWTRDEVAVATVATLRLAPRPG